MNDRLDEAWCFTKIDFTGTKTEVSFATSSLDSVVEKPLQSFIQFLRGCGYTIGYDEVTYKDNGSLK